jgi:hypothetical protein
MIVIISHEKDPHATTVRQLIQEMGEPVMILDVAEFPQRSRLALSISGNGAHGLYLNTAQGSIDFAQCRSVWWRRPQPMALDPAITDPAYTLFAQSECHEAIHGLWEACPAFWINPPNRDAVAHRKVKQLELARTLRIPIPETLITNDPDEARTFVSRFGPERVICKAFSATETHWRETRLVKEQELAQIDAVRYAPVIFQEYVPAVYDLRVTVIGREVFAAAIHSQETAYTVDCRMDIGRARMEAVDLPEAVRGQLFALMDSLGLVYGAIDLRLKPDGTYVFLEVNPAGQFLFIEAVTGQPIARTLAVALVRGHA